MKFKGRAILAAALLSFCLGGTSWIGVMGAYETGVAVSGWAEESEEASLPVVVIDAGHGGPDGGARAQDGTEEKAINLAIAKKLKAEAEDYPVRVVLTRETEEGLTSGEGGSWKKRDDLLARKKIIEDACPVLAVSIHLNSFPQDASVCGAQVFYAPDGKEKGTSAEDEQAEQTGEQKEAGSRDFAVSVQKALEMQVSNGWKRTAMAKSDILLMKDPVCPFILVECGFLSNPDEARRLKTAEYQSMLASAVWSGINEILCLEKQSRVPVTDSANRYGNIG